MFEIETASLEDITQVRDVLLEAAQWQVDTGRINKWDTTGFTYEWLRAIVERQELVVARAEQKILGSIMHSQVPSEAWEGADGDALYISKFNVRRAWAGQNVGEALLRWCDNYAASCGIGSIRLDCPDSPRFLDYYRRNGFQMKGSGSDGPYRYVKFEKLI